jgi:hypothetical protein
MKQASSSSRHHGGYEQARWHGQPNRLCRFEIEDGFELDRCLHWKIGWLLGASTKGRPL